MFTLFFSEDFPLWCRLLNCLQELDNLEGIDLSECKQFEELSDLPKARRRKWVNLSCCESLQYLHPSVLSSHTLVTLILDRCTKLNGVKGEIEAFKISREDQCQWLLKYGGFCSASSDLIENLDLSNTGIQTLDTSIGRLRNHKTQASFKGVILLDISLKELKLYDSGLVIDKRQQHVLFERLRSLQILYLKDCSNLFELPDNISVLSVLQELRLDGSDVKRLPESTKNLQEYEILSLENSKEFLCLPKQISRRICLLLHI